ncbi:hypothetical protein BCR36DRAFT_245795, partial [Piromyces finnis]
DSYFCKNDNCVLVDNFLKHFFIEFPDENKNNKLYILPVRDLTFENITYQYNCIDNICVSAYCSSNSQCLYDKCVNNKCIHNKDVSVVHCTYVIDKFLGMEKTPSYMHCGIQDGESCNSNKECSSKLCKNQIC